MIRRTDIDITEALRFLQQAPSEGHLPRRVAGPPVSPAEAAAEAEAIAALAQDPSRVRTCCVGCDADVPLLETAICACGGFVCAECQRIETEGVCDHDVSDRPAMDDDDELV